MMRKRCSFESCGVFCVKNNLSGIGKKNGYSELVLKIGLRVIFGDFTKSDLEKWLEKKGMETEMRENVKDFCKVAGYFINGYFTKRW